MPKVQWMVITNALILGGASSKQISIKDGYSGSAGIHIQDNVDIIIGPGTEAVAGKNDSHRWRHR